MQFLGFDRICISELELTEKRAYTLQGIFWKFGVSSDWDKEKQMEI